MTDFFTCPDCEQPTAPERDKWLAGMNVEYQEQQDRKARWEQLRMSPGARFGEELADMVKVMERSER